MTTPRTVIVTGASQGIGAHLVAAFVERGHNVVATIARHGEVRLSSIEAACDWLTVILQGRARRGWWWNGHQQIRSIDVLGEQRRHLLHEAIY